MISGGWSVLQLLHLPSDGESYQLSESPSRTSLMYRWHASLSLNTSSSFSYRRLASPPPLKHEPTTPIFNFSKSSLTTLVVF